jgi:hypothetical protein
MVLVLTSSSSMSLCVHALLDGTVVMVRDDEGGGIAQSDVVVYRAMGPLPNFIYFPMILVVSKLGLDTIMLSRYE